MAGNLCSTGKGPEAGPHFIGTKKPIPRGWSKKEQKGKLPQGGWGMHSLPSSGCVDDGTCTEAVESPGGLSAGEDMSGLLRPDVPWLLQLRQGWFGGAGAAREMGKNLLLKLPIPKYPDFGENCFLAI